MTPPPFQYGQQVRIPGVFRNLLTGALADPTTIVLKIQDPAGTETTYTYAKGEIVRDATGEYHMDYKLVKPEGAGNGGTYYARYEGDGALIAANEIPFPVGQTQF